MKLTFGVIFSALEVVVIVLVIPGYVQSINLLEWFGHSSNENNQETSTKQDTESTSSFTSKNIQIIDELPEGEQVESVTNLLSVVNEDLDSTDEKERKKTMDLMQVFEKTLYQPTVRYAKVLVKNIWHLVDLGASGSIQRENNREETERFVFKLKRILGEENIGTWTKISNNFSSVWSSCGSELVELIANFLMSWKRKTNKDTHHDNSDHHEKDIDHHLTHIDTDSSHTHKSQPLSEHESPHKSTSTESRSGHTLPSSEHSISHEKSLRPEAEEMKKINASFKQNAPEHSTYQSNMSRWPSGRKQHPLSEVIQEFSETLKNSPTTAFLAKEFHNWMDELKTTYNENVNWFQRRYGFKEHSKHTERDSDSDSDSDGDDERHHRRRAYPEKVDLLPPFMRNIKTKLGGFVDSLRKAYNDYQGQKRWTPSERLRHINEKYRTDLDPARKAKYIGDLTYIINNEQLSEEDMRIFSEITNKMTADMEKTHSHKQNLGDQHQHLNSAHDKENQQHPDHSSVVPQSMPTHLKDCAPVVIIHDIAVPRLANGVIDKNSPQYAQAMEKQKESIHHHPDTSTIQTHPPQSPSISSHQKEKPNLPLEETIQTGHAIGGTTQNTRISELQKESSNFKNMPAYDQLKYAENLRTLVEDKALSHGDKEIVRNLCELVRTEEYGTYRHALEKSINEQKIHDN